MLTYPRVLGAVCVLLVPWFVSVPLRSEARAQPRRQARFCDGTLSPGQTADRALRPHLFPRDDAAQRPDFHAFRQQLQDAVTRRDKTALLKSSDANVVIDFGGGAGLDALGKYIDDPEQDFWREFGHTLALGGTFDEHGAFVAPYVTATWPEELDSFECAAIVASGVRLREAPSASSRIVTLLAFDIVEISSRQTKAWTGVRLSTGETGFVASEFVRSPVDRRARFTRTKDGWRLVSFVAGD